MRNRGSGESGSQGGEEFNLSHSPRSPDTLTPRSPVPAIPHHFPTQPYKGIIYRLVEGQHFIATRKLVDSDAEQYILEQLLDNTKPPAPTHNSRGALHYLLYTPFRYPPLKDGGRFHTRMEQSIFYGSETLEVAMAEIAYGRFLFFRHSEAQFTPMTVPYTHFTVMARTNNALFLHRPPFDAFREQISHPSSYANSQPLGAAMRQAGVELFTYFSARAEDGVNVGLFTTEAFAHNQPSAKDSKHWNVFITHQVVEFQRPHIARMGRSSYVFRG